MPMEIFYLAIPDNICLRPRIFLTMYSKTKSNRVILYLFQGHNDICKFWGLT